VSPTPALGRRSHKGRPLSPPVNNEQTAGFTRNAQAPDPMSSLSHRHCMVVLNYYPIGEPRVLREVEALGQAGAAVDVICLRGPGEPAREAFGTGHIYRLPMGRDKRRGVVGQFAEYLAFFILAFIRLTQLHLRRGYQVVQVHNLPDFLVFAALVPRLTGSAILLDLHDLMPEFFASRFGGRHRAGLRLVRLQERLSCRFSHHVITVTQPWREALIARGLPPEKCSVVMNVADDHIFRPLARPLGAAGQLHCLYHGNLTRRYGLDLVLHALARARREAPGLRLTLHGWGEFLPELRQLAQSLDLDGAVTFSTGLVPVDELPHLLATADVGLIPYRRDAFTDGILPTKLMEYAATGLPAIVARTPVIGAYFAADMLETFEASDVDGLADCLLRLCRDPQRRAKLARNIQQFNAQHNWAAERAGYLSLVKRLAPPQRPAPLVVRGA
jgi:glycosyltransferase involved in cell wall biosynthesis